MKFRIFISSVQKEFAEERRMLAEYIHHDPLLGVFFEVFLFEETPACDVAAPEVYLPEVAASDIYLGILGAEYGNVCGRGRSPTEREYDAATAGGKERLVFVRRGVDRDPRQERFVRRIQADVVRKSFSTAEELKSAVCHRDYASHGGVQVMVFRDRVEIINPGTLPKGWTAEMLTRTHHSEPRNTCIAKALNWAGYVERSGNGTESILARCAEYELKTPEFKVGSADFRTIIWRRSACPVRQGQTTGPQGQTAGPRQGQPVGPVEWPSRVFEAIREAGEASKADIAVKIGHPRTSGNIKRALRILLADGLVEYTIPGTPRSRLQKYRLTDKGRDLGIRPARGEEDAP